MSALPAGCTRRNQKFILSLNGGLRVRVEVLMIHCLDNFWVN